jgi:hypothetical protein
VRRRTCAHSLTHSVTHSLPHSLTLSLTLPHSPAISVQSSPIQSTLFTLTNSSDEIVNHSTTPVLRHTDLTTSLVHSISSLLSLLPHHFLTRSFTRSTLALPNKAGHSAWTAGRSTVGHVVSVRNRHSKETDTLICISQHIKPYIRCAYVYMYVHMHIQLYTSCSNVLLYCIVLSLHFVYY